MRLWHRPWHQTAKLAIAPAVDGLPAAHRCPQGSATVAGMDKASRFTTSRLTPEQHRAKAEEIRKASGPEWLAKEHERVATMIETRQARTDNTLRTEMLDLKVLQTKLDDARQEVRNLTVMGMAPDRTPEKAALIHNLERSARAEVKLRLMALEYAKTKHD
jgi:hypothetical protein